MSHETLGALALKNIADQTQETRSERAVRQVKFARRDDGPVEHLGELAISVRNEFRLAATMPDVAILRALQTVMAQTSARSRWLALFNSDLGKTLAGQGRDLNTAMGFILAQLPARHS